MLVTSKTPHRNASQSLIRVCTTAPGCFAALGETTHHSPSTSTSSSWKCAECNWLEPPLWKIWKSVGMRKFPIYIYMEKMKVMFQTTNILMHITFQPSKKRYLQDAVVCVCERGYDGWKTALVSFVHRKLCMWARSMEKAGERCFAPKKNVWASGAKKGNLRYSWMVGHAKHHRTILLSLDRLEGSCPPRLVGIAIFVCMMPMKFQVKSSNSIQKALVKTPRLFPRIFRQLLYLPKMPCGDCGFKKL